MAISLDTSTNGGIATTTLEWTHVLDASANLILIGVGAGDTTTDDLVTVKCGSAVGTVISTAGATDDQRFIYLVAIANPPTGSQTIHIEFGSAHAALGNAASFIGANVSGFPSFDAVATSLENTSFNISPTITTTVADCLVFAFASHGAAVSAFSSNDADTTWLQNGFLNTVACGVSSTTRSQGSNAMHISTGGGNKTGLVMVSLAPSGGAASDAGLSAFRRLRDSSQSANLRRYRRSVRDERLVA